MRLRPRQYSGRDEDVDCWLQHFEGICVAGGITEEAQKIALLGVSLTGIAAQWARANGRWLNHTDRTWNEVKTRFLQRFEERDLEARLYEQLRRMKQRDNERVRDYLGRF